MNLNGWRTRVHHYPMIVLERENDVTSKNDELQPDLQLSRARTRGSLRRENHGSPKPNIHRNTRSRTTRAMTSSQTEARGANRPSMATTTATRQYITWLAKNFYVKFYIAKLSNCFFAQLANSIQFDKTIKNNRLTERRACVKSIHTLKTL